MYMLDIEAMIEREGGVWIQPKSWVPRESGDPARDVSQQDRGRRREDVERQENGAVEESGERL